MATANIVWIKGVPYAPNHPVVLRMSKELVKEAKQTVIVAHESLIRKPTPEEALNQTERKYLHILRSRFPFQPIMIQAITLRLAHNTKYTPDFAYTLPTGALVFVEVKGSFVREDAIVKLKTAAAMFPQFTFIKAKYVKGKWTETVIPK